jgi:hypothetical protein
VGPRLEPTVRRAAGFRRTIGANIADLRRVWKGGSGLLTRTPDASRRRTCVKAGYAGAVVVSSATNMRGRWRREGG